MIYDCPQCGTPQEAGTTICPHCRAQFDGPVPDDAVLPQDFVAPAAAAVPEAAAPEAALSETHDSEAHGSEARVYDAPESDETPPQSVPPETPADAETISAAAEADSIPAEAGPAVIEVKPPPATGDQPYLTPPSYSPPPYVPPSYSPPPPPMRPPLGSLTRALLIAFPIVLILVLGGVYFASSLNSGADISDPPLPVQPARSSALPPAPIGAPVTLSGGSNSSVPDNDPRSRQLVGRWQAKSGEEYEFSADGTGTHKGPAAAGASPAPPEQSFTWGVAQNKVMLYMSQDQTLRFNPGPDNNAIFLASQAGRYIQYARVKNT